MTILIVDDHANLRGLLREWLQEEFPGCCFMEAGTGKDAISYCADSAPDLVLMDINLPEMDGIQTTSRITTGHPDVPVVILTIYENGIYKEAAARAGACGYVVKDRLHEDLVPLISDLLQKQERLHETNS